jgi:hypothetical protein
MLSSMIGSVASFLGMNEADRIQKTLSILDAAPDDVPTAKLMVSKGYRLKIEDSNTDDRSLLWTHLLPAKHVDLAPNCQPMSNYII